MLFEPAIEEIDNMTDCIKFSMSTIFSVRGDMAFNNNNSNGVTTEQIIKGFQAKGLGIDKESTEGVETNGEHW